MVEMKQQNVGVAAREVLQLIRDAGQLLQLPLHSCVVVFFCAQENSF